MAAMMLFFAPPSKAQDEAAVRYRAMYEASGYLLRSSAVCTADDPKRTIKVAFSIVASPEYQAFSRGFPQTIEGWLRDGGASFNSEVAQGGVAASCKAARAVRRSAEELLDK